MTNAWLPGRRLLVILAAAALGAGCTGSAAPTGGRPSGSGAPAAQTGTAGTAAPTSTAAPNVGSPAATFVSGSPQPTTPSLAAGRWVVDLTGPRPGAGRYEGAADSLCANPAGTGTWTATLIPSGSPVTMIDLGSASGFDTVSVSTAPSSDFDGQWFFRSDAPQTFAEVVGDGTANPPTVRGTARYTDTLGRLYTAAVTVYCAQTFH